MKKIFALLLCLFASAIVFAASQSPVYVDTEQKYVFSVDNLSQTIPEFVEDTAKQDAMANKYLELANKETGAVSVKDLFEICEAGGFKTRRAEGYESCRNFVVKLLDTVEQELEDGTLTGYCPENVLLGNGKWLNGLKSITAETKVGDFCSSSNIAAGEVVFKKGYNCTCAAFACNSCCESKGGACLTKVADGNGNCLRKEYDNVQNLNVEGAALKFCESKAQRGCKVINAIKNFNSIKGKVVCNATQAEFDAVVALNTPCPDTAYALTSNNDTKEKCHSFCQTQTKAAGCKLARSLYRPSTKECVCNPDTETVRRLNMKYYQVCGKDKGKTGSQEICKDNLFTNKVYGGTQVSVNIAIALAKEWARKNGYREIECDTKPYEYNSLDDSILCSSIDPDKNGKRAYFDFVFDDVKESKDITLNDSFYHALAYIIYGYHSVQSAGTRVYDTGTEAKCTELSQALERMCGGGAGCSMKWRSVEIGESMMANDSRKFCFINQDSDIENLNKKNSPEDFHNPFNIDPFMFCKGAQTQLQNTSSVDVLLRQYISNASGYPMSKIECFAKTFRYLGVGCKYAPHGFVIDGGDDIKRCVVHGDKDYYVDFVFDDITEFSKKREKGALQSMGCVVSGGTFNGQECKFANKSQCDTYIKSMSKVCPQCTKPKWNPDTGLCEVPDAAAVTAMEKHEKTAMIIGGVVVSVVVTVATAGSGAPVIAIVLSGVEVAGGAMEYFAQQHIDGMAHEFFLKSAKCNNASCAAKMLSEDLQEMANIQNDLEDYEINALDAEFERLLGLIDPGSDFYMAIVEKGATLEDNQKGFFDPDGWNQAQVWRAVGIGLQFLSLGTGAITKIIGSARFGSKFPKMQAMLLKQVKITKQIRDAKKVTSAVEMSAGQAKRLDELDGKIATLESKTNRSAAEADELKKLHQERNELKNKIGTKDADELDKAKNAAFDKKAVETANKEYDTAKQRYDYVRKYMAEHNGNPPKGTDKYAVQKINNDMAAAEKKLKDLGQDVEPVEPLQIGKKPTVEPAEAKPVESGTNPKETNGEPKLADDLLIDMSNNVNQSRLMAGKLNKTELAKLRKHYPDLDDLALQQKAKEIGQEISKQKIANGGFLDSEVRWLDDYTVTKNEKEIEKVLGNDVYSFQQLKQQVKNTPGRTLAFSKDALSDEEWKILNEALDKDNMEVVSAGSNMIVRKKLDKMDAISDIRSKAYSEFDTHMNNIKKGTEKELNIPKSHLSDDEWKALEADLNKEGLEITEANDHYFRVKKSTKANPVSNVANKTDNVADAGKGVKPTKTAGKWANATVPDPAFDIKVTPLELGGKKYYLKSGDTESLIQNEISRTKQAHKLLKHNKIVTSVDVVEDNQTILKAFMDDHPEITLPRTPDTQYFIMDATHVNTVEELSDAEILGYLRNKPITIKEQNTILSELQNMNNNGLIHNDIGHNFAIYRDSGGKLHMELMDFGDFTSEQKLLRSNDDVLEIKKLFSKWSDKGLVEKTATPKVTANTASKTAGKANDVAKVSASEAKAANVATLRQSASKSFDKYLAEVKTSPTGKGAKLPKSRLNDAGWNTVNESLARDNVQLIDTGDGYMQFVRADHIDEAEIIGVEVVDASKGVKPTKTAGNVVLDENELVRFKGNGGKVVNKDYIQASKDARNFMNNAIESGEYTKSVDGYIESINDMHKVSANGANGNLNWYADAGQGSLDVNPGKIRGKIGRLSNGRVEEASRVEQIARKYGDPFSITKNSKVELSGIPRNNLPEDEIVDGHFRHVYPDGGDALRPYYEQMYRTSKEALELIDNQASERAILEKIAEHYQYAANARPYGQINNSLFMNEANTLLQKAGLRTMPHGELDHAAMHLQPDAFKRYFVDTYYATKL